MIAKKLWLCVALFTIHCSLFISPAGAQNWVGTWATAVENTGKKDMPQQMQLTGNSVRQIVHVSLGGDVLRLQLSNEFGSDAVEIKSVYVADALEGKEIDKKTAQYLKFDGKPGVTIAPGKTAFSDALKYKLRPLQLLSITVCYGQSPEKVTSHRGSRTRSYIMQGESKPKADFVVGETLEHWYNIAAIDVVAPEGTPCIAILGNSITDGRGSTTDKQDRWPDMLSNALGGKVGVLNLGIGGNCVLEGGISQPAVERFDRDIMSQRGLTAVIIFEGINDIGGSKNAERTARRLINAYKELIGKARAKNLKVYGGTITQMLGSSHWSYYHEAARQEVNEWIRTGKAYDAVIDFDRVTLNPDNPQQLRPDLQSDKLHPNARGYQLMGEAAAQIVGK